MKTKRKLLPPEIATMDLNDKSNKTTQGAFQDVLRLRIEYLKRGPLYKALCEFLRENKSVSFPKDLPQKFQSKAGLLATYIMFGDIHKPSFSIDDAVSLNQSWIELFNAAASSPVADYCELISSGIDGHIKRFAAAHGKEPTLIEFRDSFAETMKNTGHLYLRIDTADHDMKTLEKQFKKLVRDHRKKAMFLFPTGYVKTQELRTYLQAYDLKTKTRGLTIKKLVQIMDPKRKGEPADIEREFKRYIQKAKKIIANTEKGVFPGTYQSKTSTTTD